MKDSRTVLKKTKLILIFGAGKNDWLKLKDEIAACGRKVNYYVVSSKNDNPNVIDQVPVKELNEIRSEEKEGTIIISNALCKQKEIGELLKKEGFSTVFYGIRWYSSLSEPEKEYYKSCGLNINMDFPRSKDLDRGSIESLNLQIYVVTSHLNLHHSKQKFISNTMCYIQAGSALTDKDICQIKDNTGDHISEKNKYFCELTAGYWIYKNDSKHDYVGLYHYSRMLDIDEKELLKVFNSGINVILSEPLICFSRRKNFWESEPIIRKVISYLYPEYITTYNFYIEEGVFVPSNLIITKKEIFDQFYKWLFAIFDEYEKILHSLKMKIGLRDMGYLAEELTGVYFFHNSNKWKIFYIKQKAFID